MATLSEQETEIIMTCYKELIPFGGHVAAWPKGKERQAYEQLVGKGLLMKRKFNRGQGIEVYSPTREGIESLSERQVRICRHKLKTHVEMLSGNKRYHHIDNYVYERQHHWYTNIPGKRICMSCWSTTKNQKCPCGANTEHLDVRARIPKRNAKKSEWEQFFGLFKPAVLTDPNWWKNRPLK